MMYGVPQTVEYDTSVPPLEGDTHPVEWMHGCPAKLQLIMVDINIRRAWNRIGPAPDWRGLEHRLLSWQPPVSTVPGEESWRAIARLAVQESWRHALLIYLYMVG
jgi:hypothetical protein